MPAIPERSTTGPADAASRVLVLGVGNLLMGDEGVGIHVLRELEEDPPDDGVRLLDGGTDGTNLRFELEGYPAMILVDAAIDGLPAGTVSYQRPRHLGELPRGLGARDFGLMDLFAVADHLDPAPSLHLFTISIETGYPMCLELSPAVSRAAPQVARGVRELAKRLNAP